MTITDELAGAPVGVILHDGGEEAGALLAAFAAELKAAGVQVGGLVQRNLLGPDGRPRMELVDLRSGEVFRISLELGAGSDACSLDTSGLADSTRVLRREIAAGVDLLVINKFSARECEGEGLASEMFEAISEGIPLLTTLNRRHLAQWRQATGGAGQMLAPAPEALRAWWRSVAP